MSYKRHSYHGAYDVSHAHAQSLLHKIQHGPSSYKTLLHGLTELNDAVITSRTLTQGQKTSLNDVLVSTNSLVQSLAIQFTDNDIPKNIYTKLHLLVENVTRLVRASGDPTTGPVPPKRQLLSSRDVLQHNLAHLSGSHTNRIGIFQDRVLNLSPSLTSHLMNQYEQDDDSEFEDEVVHPLPVRAFQPPVQALFEPIKSYKKVRPQSMFVRPAPRLS